MKFIARLRQRIGIAGGVRIGDKNEIANPAPDIQLIRSQRSDLVRAIGVGLRLRAQRAIVGLLVGGKRHARIDLRRLRAQGLADPGLRRLVGRERCGQIGIGGVHLPLERVELRVVEGAPPVRRRRARPGAARVDIPVGRRKFETRNTLPQLGLAAGKHEGERQQRRERGFHGSACSLVEASPGPGAVVRVDACPTLVESVDGSFATCTSSPSAR